MQFFRPVTVYPKGDPENHDAHFNPGLTDPSPEMAKIMEAVRYGKEPDKASVAKGDGPMDILVDRHYWDQLGANSRSFLLFHEVAHKQGTGCAGSCPEAPDGCERCADTRAGACMAAEGFTLRQTLDAVKGLKFTSRRTTLLDAEKGWAAYKTKAPSQTPNGRYGQEPVMSRPAPVPTPPKATKPIDPRRPPVQTTTPPVVPPVTTPKPTNPGAGIRPQPPRHVDPRDPNAGEGGQPAPAEQPCACDDTCVPWVGAVGLTVSVVMVAAALVLDG